MALTELSHPDVQPFHSADTPKAMETSNAAFSTSPLKCYVGAGSGPLPSYGKTYLRLMFSLYRKTRVMFTIDHGVCVLVANFGSQPTPVEKRYIRILRLIQTASLLTYSSEQRKRLAEVEKKYGVLDAKAKLDEQPGEWAYLDSLWTAPDCQRRGYASALLKALNDQLDASGKNCWLYAEGIREDLYAAHGFKTVASIAVGDENPTWQDDPIMINVMVREPKSPS